MRTIRWLVLGGLLVLPACSSSPTEPEVDGRSAKGTIVGPGHQGSEDPCSSMGRLALKCDRLRK